MNFKLILGVIWCKHFSWLLVFCFTFARIATWFYPLDSDHWIFYYVGRNIVEGKILYLQAWDHKPPLIFLYNSFLYLLFADNVILHRIFFTVLVILETYIFYILWKKLWNLIPNPNLQNLQQNDEDYSQTPASPKTNLKNQYFNKPPINLTKFVLLNYVFWRNLSQFTSSGNNTENIALPFLLLMFITFIEYRNRLKTDSWKNFYLFLSGILLSILFFLKGNFGIFAVPIIVELLLESIHKYRLIFHDNKKVENSFSSPLIKNINLNLNFKTRIVFVFKIVKCFLSLAVFMLPLFIHFGFYVAYFTYHNALNEFLVATFSFSSKYVVASFLGKVSNQTIFILISSPFWVCFALANIIFLYYFYKNFRYIVYRLLFVWGLVGIIFVAMLGSFYSYYYLILIPIFTLLIGFNLGKSFVPNKKQIFELNFVGITSLQKVLFVSLLISSIIYYPVSLRQMYNSFGGKNHDILKEDIQVAEYIKKNTTQEDTIFANVYGAGFYSLTERNSGSRFISASVLLLDYRENFGFDLNSKLISDLQNSRCKYIIREKDIFYDRNLPVKNYIDQNYKPEKEFDNYTLWVIKG